MLLILVFVIGVPVLLYMAWLVHRGLGRLCVGHARRFAARDGSRSLSRLDAQKQRRLILPSVWPFGVRGTVSDEVHPESYDGEWP
ncbi:hypothetical protein [Brevifollis gellanilyticus]|nr:hypothetical protein [Brevifollis gellanilyticus]